METEKKFYPLSSLEWEFWNQARTNLFSEDKNAKFTEHATKRYLANIEHIAKEKNVSTEQVLIHLKKFWDKAMEGLFMGHRQFRKRFESFCKKTIL